MYGRLKTLRRTALSPKLFGKGLGGFRALG